MISWTYDIIVLWYHRQFMDYAIIGNIMYLWYHIWYHIAQPSRSAGLTHRATPPGPGFEPSASQVQGSNSEAALGKQWASFPSGTLSSTTSKFSDIEDHALRYWRSISKHTDIKVPELPSGRLRYMISYMIS